MHPPTFSALDNSNINIDAETNDFEHALDTHSDTRDNEVASGTLSSPDISDHELPVEDLSHDDSAEHIECQERRDSGVGSSLTRTNRSVSPATTLGVTPCFSVIFETANNNLQV